MSSLAEQYENERYRRKDSRGDVSALFSTEGSAGTNNAELARILAVFDTFILLLGWQDKPLARFSHIMTQYQASVDAQYHNDYRDVLIAEAIEKKLSERKGTNLSLIQQS